MTSTNAPAVGNPAAVNAAAVHAKAAELGKLVLKMTTAAASGHPSSALALSHLTVELMYRRMRYDLADPWNPNNDRLVLSEGHAVPIVYAAYADLGGTVGVDRAHARPLKVDELSTLRELTGVLEGHPNPAEGFPFFDAATGSLGQGLSVGAGLAGAARLDGIDKRVYVIVGDGESREGQIWEAADFVVDHGLSNVCMILSCNGHGQASEVSSQQSAKTLAAKMAAFGWHVIELDGHDPEAIAAAFDEVESTPKPTALVARTVKGWGVDLMLGKNFHGKPVLAADLDKACAQLDATVKRLGATSDDTITGPRVPAPYAGTSDAPACALPTFAEGLSRIGLDAALDKKKLATRVAYGAALVALGDVDQRVVSLDSDVSNSTFSLHFAKHHADRFFECKIAEQNMISVGVGLAAAGKIPFASSFAKFIARAVDQIDMAAISRVNLKIVGSHGGASLGPDGPSQMSLSDVAYFRSMTRVDNGRGTPVCHFFQPSDAISAYACVELMAEVDGLCFMRTHRGEAPFLYALDEGFDLCGVKQLRTGDRVTLVSSGFMLHTVLKAADALAEFGIACNVFDAYTFPMESAPILKAAMRAGGAILTVEDNFIGGLHSELAEVAALEGRVRVAGLTVNRLPRSAKSADETFAYVGVGLDRILERAKSLA